LAAARKRKLIDMAKDTRSPLAPSATVKEAQAPSKPGAHGPTGYGADTILDKSWQQTDPFIAPQGYASQQRDPNIRRDLGSIHEGRADGGKVGAKAGFTGKLPKK
jgi:hypothetical protein